MTQYFIDRIREHAKGRTPAMVEPITRFEASIGPLCHKICELPGVDVRHFRTRQMKFTWKGQEYKARFRHLDGGKLEILKVHGSSDGQVMVTLRCLKDTMDLNLPGSLPASGGTVKIIVGQKG
jgi:hypothetical protein